MTSSQSKRATFCGMRFNFDKTSVAEGTPDHVTLTRLLAIALYILQQRLASPAGPLFQKFPIDTIRMRQSEPLTAVSLLGLFDSPY